VSQKPGPSPKATAKPAEQPGVKKRELPCDAGQQDVVLIRGVSEDGSALAVLRARADRVEAGVVRAVKEGQPIDGELVRLKPRADCPLVCDVESEAPSHPINASGGSESRPSHSGPAQVATPEYRSNWDAIWSKPKASAKKPLPN
jgi:hypothetical protein